MRTWMIALKDTRVRFADRHALLTMLVAPLVLALIMSAAFQTDTPDARILPVTVAVVNADTGAHGAAYVAALHQASESVTLQLVPDRAAAEQALAAGQAQVALVIAPSFSDTLAGQPAHTPASITIVRDPAAPVAALLVTSVAQQLAVPFGTAQVARTLNASASDQTTLAANPTMSAQQVRVTQKPLVGASVTSSPLAFFMPSMAIFFLMFTMFDGTRSLLMEQQHGTLSRLLTTPVRFWQVLAGKLAGTFLTGMMQFGILVLVSWLVLGVSWGRSPLALLLMMSAFVAAASGIGALVAASARDLTQAMTLGSSLTLLFGLLGGNFFSLTNGPAWLQLVSYLSINRWGLTGFTDLTLRGGGLSDILWEAGILFGIGGVCFALASVWLPQRFRR